MPFSPSFTNDPDLLVDDASGTQSGLYQEIPEGSVGTLAFGCQMIDGADGATAFFILFQRFRRKEGGNLELIGEAVNILEPRIDPALEGVAVRVVAADASHIQILVTGLDSHTLRVGFNQLAARAFQIPSEE